MRCIICDKCKKEIQDPRRIRRISCVRPAKRPKPWEPQQEKPDTPPLQDLFWEKEICIDCALLLEEWLDAPPEEKPDPTPEPTPKPDPTPTPNPGGEGTGDNTGATEDTGTTA